MDAKSGSLCSSKSCSSAFCVVVVTGFSTPPWGIFVTVLGRHVTLVRALGVCCTSITIGAFTGGQKTKPCTTRYLLMGHVF